MRLLNIKRDAFCLIDEAVHLIDRRGQLADDACRQACKVLRLIEQGLRLILEALDLVVDLLECSGGRQQILTVVWWVEDDCLRAQASRSVRGNPGSDENLNRQLDDLMALLAEQVRKATAKPFLPMARLETSALITYLVGLLVLKQGRKIDVLGNNAAVLLAHYTKNMFARLGGRA